MTDDLITWLRYQINQDERTARFVLSDYAEHEATWNVPSTGVVQLGDDLLPVGDGPLAYHIACWDPDRVLREAQAKQMIITREVTRLNEQWRRRSEEHQQTFPDWLIEAGYSDLLRLLAMPYSTRDGYRDEWRPE